MKGALSREYLHVPLYVWLAGAGAFVVTVLYFMKSRGSATAGTAASTAAPMPGVVNYSSTQFAPPSTTPGSTSTSPPPGPMLPAGLTADATSPFGWTLKPGYKWVYQTGATLKDIANKVNAQFGSNISAADVAQQNPDIAVGAKTYRVAVPSGGSGGGIPVYSPGAAPQTTMVQADHPGWAFLPQSTAMGLMQAPAMNSQILSQDAMQQGPSVIPAVQVQQPTPMYTQA